MSRRGWAVAVAAMLVAAVVLVVALTSPAPEVTRRADTSRQAGAQPPIAETPPALRMPSTPGTVRYVTPTGGGARDGSSWESAATLADLPRLVAASAPGDEVWLHGGQGAYALAEPIVLRDGGKEDTPVVVRGVEGAPLLQGERASPFQAGGDEGEEVFRLLAGADHLSFSNLHFRDIGNGCFRIGEDVTDLEVTDVRAENVVRFFEDYASGDAESASVRGLTLRRVSVDGYAKGAVRLRYDSAEVLLEDVEGAGDPGAGEDYPIGVHLEDSAHDVTHRRVTMRNSISRRADDEYWNGDGFAAERGTFDLRFEDTLATGNTDAGYDLKSSSTQLIGAIAEGNGRNYRFWGAGIEARACEGRAPERRGGTTTQAQVQGNDGADAVLHGCRFLDDDPATIVFDIDGDGSVLVEGGSVHLDEQARLQTAEEGARLEMVDVDVEPG